MKAARVQRYKAWCIPSADTQAQRERDRKRERDRERQREREREKNAHMHTHAHARTHTHTHAHIRAHIRTHIRTQSHNLKNTWIPRHTYHSGASVVDEGTDKCEDGESNEVTQGCSNGCGNVVWVDVVAMAEDHNHAHDAAKQEAGNRGCGHASCADQQRVRDAELVMKDNAEKDAEKRCCKRNDQALALDE